MTFFLGKKLTLVCSQTFYFLSTLETTTWTSIVISSNQVFPRLRKETCEDYNFSLVRMKAKWIVMIKLMVPKLENKMVMSMLKIAVKELSTKAMKQHILRKTQDPKISVMAKRLRNNVMVLLEVMNLQKKKKLSKTKHGEI